MLKGQWKSQVIFCSGERYRDVKVSIQHVVSDVKKKKKEHAVSEAEKKQGCGTHFPKRQPSGTFSLLQTDFWVCTKLPISLSTSVFVNCISSSGTVCYGKTLHLEESVHLRSSSKVSAAFIGLAYSWSFHS